MTFQIGTFASGDAAPYAGLVVEAKVHALKDLLGLARDLGVTLRESVSTLGLLEHWSDNLPSLRALADALAAGKGPSGLAFTDAAIRSGALRVLPPVQPRQIFQAGANYHKHVVDLIVDGALARDPTADAEEIRTGAAQMMHKRAASGKPFVFMGLASTLTGPFDPILLPYDVKQPDWELELVAVIGRPTRRVSAAQALDCVAGYTIANDITARELVPRPDAPQMGMDWLASKCSPTFLPVGPYITPAQFVRDPQSLQVTLHLNDKVMQDESTADMIFSVARLIEFISAHVTLLPGDLVLTGSPSGNGTHYHRFLTDGDEVTGQITGLGSIRNPCVAEVAQ